MLELKTRNALLAELMPEKNPAGQSRVNGNAPYPGLVDSMPTSDDLQPEIASAVDLRDVEGYIRLPIPAMQECGPPARTLGAVMELLNKRSSTTFASVRKIAEMAGLPFETTKRHLAELVDTGWLTKQPPRRRRTATYRLTKAAKASIREYLPLPRWWDDPRFSVTASYAAILGQLCKAEHVAEKQDLEMDDEKIEFLSRLSISKIAELTGLGRQAIVNGINELESSGLILREFDRKAEGFRPKGTHYTLVRK